MLKKFKAHSEKIAYVLAGGWNTGFGLLAFAALYHLLSRHAHYLVILVISNILSITNAYISYKFLVFKTRGNYLREYFRFYLVYGVSFLANIGLMYVFVDYLGVRPVIAQGAILVVIFTSSYAGHKYFSFKSDKSGLSGAQEAINK